MNSFEAYVLYLALKQHFRDKSYDFFRYSGKVSASVSSFEKRYDRYAFTKLSKHRDPKGLVLANLLINRNVTAQECVSQQGQQNYLEWARKNQSISYLFSEELKVLDKDFKSNFTIKNGSIPKIMHLFFEKKISLETFVIILDSTGVLTYYDNKLGTNTLWNDISFLVKKYIPFIEYDKKFAKASLRNLLNSNQEAA